MDGSSGAGDGDEINEFIGRVVGQYRIESSLGVGGMGEVFLAHDLHLDRRVAIKRVSLELRNLPGFEHHLLDEALKAVRASNMRIAQVLHHFEEDGEEYLVMDYIVGPTLRELLRGPLELNNFYQLAIRSTEALLATHRNNIVHCDVKPENFIVEPKGGVRLLDMGIATEVAPEPDGDGDGEGEDEEDAKTKPLVVAPILSGLTGTPRYTPPEVLHGTRRDFRSDLFALGTMFHEMLSGRHPFHAKDEGAITRRIRYDEPDLIPEREPKLPGELQRLVTRCLAKDPAQRPQSAQEILHALLQIQDPVPTTPEPRLELGRPWRRWVVVVLAVLGTAGLVRLLWPHPPDLPPNRLVALETFTGADEASAVQAAGLSTAAFELLRRSTNPQALASFGPRRREFAPLQAAFLDVPALANLVLRGSLTPAGERARVALTLFDPTSTAPLRKRSLEVDPTDGIACAHRIGQSIADLLDLDLSPAEVDALLRISARKGAAAAFDLQGWGLLRLHEEPTLWRRAALADTSDTAHAALLDQAEAVFRQAAGIDSMDADAWVGLARVDWERPGGNSSTALARTAETCQRALGIDLEHAGAHALLGEVYVATNRTLAAIPELERALVLDPTRNAALRSLAIQYRKLDRTADVDRLYKAAVDLRPQHPYVLGLYGQYCFSVARYGDAADLFEHYVEIAPREPYGFKSLGSVYILQGRYENAIPHLQAALALKPDRDAFNGLGTAYFMMRRFAAAESTYRRAINFDANDARHWGNLGDAYYWNPGQRALSSEPYRMAERLVGKALEGDANNVVLLGRSAHYQSQLGDRWGARRTLDRALELAPKNHELRYKEALYYVHCLETDSAFVALRKALEAGYSPIWVHDTPELDALRSDPRFSKLVPK